MRPTRTCGSRGREGGRMNDLIRWRALVATALVVVGCGISPAHAQTWARRAPFPEPSEELYGIASGGRLYVFGGLAPGWKPKALVLRIRSRSRHVDPQEEHAAAVPPHGPRGDRRQDLRRRWIPAARLRPRGLAAHRQRVGIRSGGGQLEGARPAAYEAWVRQCGGRERQDLRDRRRRAPSRLEGDRGPSRPAPSRARYQRSV